MRLVTRSRLKPLFSISRSCVLSSQALQPLRRECYTRPVNTRGFAKITLVIAFLVAALVAGSWSYFRRSPREAPAAGKPSPQVQTQATPPAAATPGNTDEKIKPHKSEPLPTPA